MTITDNQGKELQKNLKTNNDFGSIFDQVTLQENIQTGVYAISLTTEE